MAALKSRERTSRECFRTRARVGEPEKANKLNEFHATLLRVRVLTARQGPDRAMLNLAKQIFGSVNERKVKRHARAGTAHQCAGAELRGAFGRSPAQQDQRISPPVWPAAPRSTTSCPEAFATVREAAKRVARDAPFRRPDDGRHRSSIRARSPKCAPAKARRWSPRCRSISTRSKAAASTSSPSTITSPSATADWMGQVYRFLGMSVGKIVHGLYDNERRPSYACGHHLRHQQRIRLRLSARQHEVLAGRNGPARPPLRDRRRGRLHPGR